MPRFITLFILTIMQAGFALELHDFLHERLKFDLFFKGLNAVHAEMWLETSDSTTTIFWTLDTKPVAQFLFRVNNSYQVTLDASGTMIRAGKSIDQKNIKHDWLINYDWTAKQAISNQNITWPVVDGSRHVLGLLYDLRTRHLTSGDTVEYVLDIESQIWFLGGIVQSVVNNGNVVAHDIVFQFSPALDIVERTWKTDIVTNRLGSLTSTLIIRLGPPPQQQPLMVRFGGEGTQIEMRLTP